MFTGTQDARDARQPLACDLASELLLPLLVSKLPSRALPHSPQASTHYHSISRSLNYIMCPPGVDQTTRGPQRWYLLAPLKKQKHQFFDPHATSDLVDRYFSHEVTSGIKDATLAFQQLARLDTIPYRSGVGSIASSSGKTVAPIEDLPAELLAIVNESMDEADVLALGSCSEILWMHAVKYIEADHRRSMAPWAGTPIIHTGTYLTKLPRTIYDTFPELEDAETEYDRGIRHPVGRGPYVNRMCPARRWNWNAISSYEVVSRKSCAERWRAAFADGPIFDQTALKTVERLRGELDEVFRVPAAGGWFWRNLTLKQYVNLDLDESDDPGKLQVHVSKATWLSLDMALMAQTCWSVQDSRGYKAKEGWNGVWAGHCFDVVRELPAGEGWEDVTKSVTEAARVVVGKEDDE